MIDLHCHILPGIDDGAAELSVVAGNGRAVADGVTVVACTPHILPGVYHNTGPAIREATERLQQALDREGIALELVTGADVHIAPDLVAGLRSGSTSGSPIPATCWWSRRTTWRHRASMTCSST